MRIELSHQQRMTMLVAMPGETISPHQLADILGGDPYQYNLTAQAGRLTLPHIWRGRNLRIIKQPVINLLTSTPSLLWQDVSSTVGER